jgi:hypothetical protein
MQKASTYLINELYLRDNIWMMVEDAQGGEVEQYWTQDKKRILSALDAIEDARLRVRHEGGHPAREWAYILPDHPDYAAPEETVADFTTGGVIEEIMDGFYSLLEKKEGAGL